MSDNVTIGLARLFDGAYDDERDRWESEHPDGRADLGERTRRHMRCVEAGLRAVFAAQEDS